MKLRYKIIWFAVTPLVMALISIAFTVYYRTELLERQQRDFITRIYRDNKDIELKNYSTLAEQSIAHLYSSRGIDTAAMDEAKTILRSLNYGPDGYFFLFDLQGTFLMHPRQPELVGQNLWHIRDTNGDPSIQRLISRAREGGGLVDYMWQKPTNNNDLHVPKRAYVFVLENWGWVLGTGVYLDDISSSIEKLDKQASRNIFDTMLWIVAISFLSVITIFIGLMRNLNERTKADEKLELANDDLKIINKKLSSANEELNELTRNIINVQDKERRNIAFDLHDGVTGALGAIKMQIEMDIASLPNNDQNKPAISSFQSVVKRLKDAIDELRRVMYGIYPIDREYLSLVEALTRIAINTTRVGIPTDLNVVSKNDGLITTMSGNVLVLVAQEAFANIVTHAKKKGASQAWMRIKENSSCIKLTIRNNGNGFNKASISRGIGLRSMKARLESVEGKFYLRSTPLGTVVFAKVPRSYFKD